MASAPSAGGASDAQARHGTPAIPESFSYSDHAHYAPPRRSLPADHPLNVDPNGNHDVWVFGYGSLLWKVDFEYEEQKEGWVRGWRRVFWQGSIDHRGTYDYWGRVVTMVSPDHLETMPKEHLDLDTGSALAPATWGIAYRLPRDPAVRDKILEWLDFREKNGYECVVEDVWPTREPSADGNEEPVVRGALIYIALPTNPSFLGPASPDDVAKRIATAIGPSGKNCEYLFNLCHIVRQYGVSDPELEVLESRVKAIMAEGESAADEQKAGTSG